MHLMGKVGHEPEIGHCSPFWLYTHIEEHQSWLADTSEEELSCAVTPKKVIVHFEVL